MLRLLTALLAVWATAAPAATEWNIDYAGTGLVLVRPCTPFAPCDMHPFEFELWAPTLSFETASAADGVYDSGIFAPVGATSGNLSALRFTSPGRCCAGFDTRAPMPGLSFGGLSVTVVNGRVEAVDGSFYFGSAYRFVFSGTQVAFQPLQTKDGASSGTASIVPEPASATLLLAGMAALALRAVKRRG